MRRVVDQLVAIESTAGAQRATSSNKRAKIKSRDGFTLIEVLVALGLFVLALSCLPGVLVSAVQSSGYARRLTKATCLAQDKIETIRNTAYKAVTSGSDQTTEGPITYTRRWTVSNGPTITTRKVVATVNWTDTMSRQVELDAIIGG